MNRELIDYYVQGMLEGVFKDDSSLNFIAINDLGSKIIIEIDKMGEIERRFKRQQFSKRQQNPECGKALEIYNSPLMEALR
jgi:hypothetical protein